MVSTRLINCDVTHRLLNIAGHASRSYATIPRSYVPPVFRKDEQALFFEEEKPQIPPLIRPALPSDTSSEFFNETIRKLTNCIMRKGKKTLARQLVADTLTNVKISQLKKYHSSPESAKNQIELDPKKILLQAIENCKPVISTCNVRRGGINYTVPLPITEKRSVFLGIKFLIDAAKQKHRKEHLPESLAKDVLEAFHNTGKAVKRKQMVHRVCDENRAFAHYRWMNQGKKVH